MLFHRILQQYIVIDLKRPIPHTVQCARLRTHRLLPTAAREEGRVADTTIEDDLHLAYGCASIPK